MKTVKDIVISRSEPPVNNVGWLKPLSNGTFMLYFFGGKGWTSSSIEIPEALKAEIARLDKTDNKIKENLAAEIIRAKAAEEANAQAITDEVAERTKEVDELTNQLYEAYKVYGIEFDTTISSPTCFRIGNLDLHRSLPIQSKMRGCLLDDDGNVVKYLDQDDWTGEDRSGSSG